MQRTDGRLDVLGGAWASSGVGPTPLGSASAIGREAYELAGAARRGGRPGGRG